jgi:hypothetical protein
MPMLYVPESVCAVPETGYAWANNWWLCDPERGVLFYAHSLLSNDRVVGQCNPDKRIIEHRIERDYTNCVAKWLPVVFEAHAIRELRSLRDQDRILKVLSKESH